MKTSNGSGPLRVGGLSALLLVFAILRSGPAAAHASDASDPFPEGKGMLVVDFDGTPLNLHYHKPANYSGERFILLFSPGSCMFPTRDMDFGLGFGGLPDSLSNDERIRRYVALPITLYIGTNDTEMGQLPTGDAYDQGVHRYSRNIRWFNEAMDLAYLEEWEFNWRLVIADGPGHSPPTMFNHPQMENALLGHLGG